MSRFEGRAAIVTGGSSGIGRGIALALAREGARVAVAGRTPAHVDAALAEIGAAGGGDAARFIGLSLDVRSEADVNGMTARVIERFGGIDILVVSAGISRAAGQKAGENGAVARIAPAAWDEIVETNLKGMFLANRAVLPEMMRRGRGEILNVSSSLGTTSGWAFASAYCASKFGVMGLSAAVAEEARPFGVRVQVLVPDAVDTPMLRRSHIPVHGSLSTEQTADLALHMLASPQDVLLQNPLIEPFGPWPRVGRRPAYVA
jgi:NAD(P)-dependent dehydrogenase (short-subunit alcohol dehydrogenase family)